MAAWARYHAGRVGLVRRADGAEDWGEHDGVTYLASQRGSYIAASVALTCTLIGVILAPVFGRVAGSRPPSRCRSWTSASPRTDAPCKPPAWAHLLHGYGGFRVLIDAVLTHGFGQAGPLLITLAWLTGAAVAASVAFRRSMRTARRTSGRTPRSPVPALTASRG